MLLVTNQPVSLGGARARGASSGQRLLGRVRAGWQASTRAAQPINQRSRSPDTLSARRPCTTWRGNFAARAAVGANRRPRACTHPARSARESSVQARGAGIMPGASADVSERTKHSSRRERAPLPARSHTRPCVLPHRQSKSTRTNLALLQLPLRRRVPRRNLELGKEHGVVVRASRPLVCSGGSRHAATLACVYV